MVLDCFSLSPGSFSVCHFNKGSYISQLAQLIWLHVPVDRKQDAALDPTEARLRATLEKRTMINLIQAYSVSMKHFLRGEPGIYYADLYPLVSFLPRYAGGPPEVTESSSMEKHGHDHSQLPLWYHASDGQNKSPTIKKLNRTKTFDPEKALPIIDSDHPLLPARNPPKTSVWDFLPFLVPFRWLAKRVSRSVRQAINDAGDDRTISGKVRKPTVSS